MEESKADIVSNAIRKSGLSMTAVAKKIKVARRTLYYWFEQDTLSIDVILEIGKAIHYDFTEKIPELKKLKRLNILEEPQAEYVSRKEFESFKEEHLSEKDIEIERLKDLLKMREDKIRQLELEIRKLRLGSEKKINKLHTQKQLY